MGHSPFRENPERKDRSGPPALLLSLPHLQLERAILADQLKVCAVGSGPDLRSWDESVATPVLSPLVPPPLSRYNPSMNRSARQIFEEARQLPLHEVNWLIENLLQEREAAPDAEIEAAWVSEIKRRLDEIDSGAVELIAGDEVRAEMTASLSPEARARLCI